MVENPRQSPGPFRQHLFFLVQVEGGIDRQTQLQVIDGLQDVARRRGRLGPLQEVGPDAVREKEDRQVKAAHLPCDFDGVVVASVGQADKSHLRTGVKRLRNGFARRRNRGADRVAHISQTVFGALAVRVLGLDKQQADICHCLPSLEKKVVFVPRPSASQAHPVRLLRLPGDRLAEVGAALCQGSRSGGRSGARLPLVFPTDRHSFTGMVPIERALPSWLTCLKLKAQTRKMSMPPNRGHQRPDRRGSRGSVHPDVGQDARGRCREHSCRGGRATSCCQTSAGQNSQRRGLRDFVAKENRRVQIQKEVDRPPRADSSWPTDPEEPLSGLALSTHPWRRQVAELVERTLGHACRNVGLEATSDVPGVSPDGFGGTMTPVWVKQSPAAPACDREQPFSTPPRCVVGVSHGRRQLIRGRLRLPTQAGVVMRQKGADRVRSPNRGSLVRQWPGQARRRTHGDTDHPAGSSRFGGVRRYSDRDTRGWRLTIGPQAGESPDQRAAAAIRRVFSSRLSMLMRGRASVVPFMSSSKG